MSPFLRRWTPAQPRDRRERVLPGSVPVRIPAASGGRVGARALTRRGPHRPHRSWCYAARHAAERLRNLEIGGNTGPGGWRRRAQERRV